VTDETLLRLSVGAERPLYPPHGFFVIAVPVVADRVDETHSTNLSEKRDIVESNPTPLRIRTPTGFVPVGA
jgi:hypothetical protein